MGISNTIKLIFFDIDHTTFDHNHFMIRPLTMYALRNLKAKGYKLCIMTSRSKDETKEVNKEFIELMDTEVYLAGAYIKIGDKVKTYNLDKNNVNEIIKYFDSHNIVYRYATNDGKGYLNRSDDYVDKLFYDYFHMTPTNKIYEGEDVLQFMYYTFDNNIHEELKKLFPDLVINVMRLNSEISNNSIDKGSVIKDICEYFNISLNKTMAFGDSENDISMIEKCGFGVAVGNSVDSLKNVADYVCEKQDDDGVYKTFVKYGFIDEYKFTNNYIFNKVIDSLGQYSSYDKDIDSVSSIFVNTIKNNGIIQLIGLNKNEEFAQELYYRSGGMVYFHKIVVDDLYKNNVDINNFKKIFSLYEIDSNDLFVFIIEDDKDEYILSLSKYIKNLGYKVIFFIRNNSTNIIETYSDYVVELLPIFEPINRTIDNSLAMMIMFKTYELLKKNNIEPLIYKSNNSPNSKDHNKNILSKYGKRVHE